MDLHVHSKASDGEFTAGEISGIAQECGLELVAIADHDEGRASIELAQLCPDIAVAAIELTCTGFGGYADLLGLGLQRPEAIHNHWTFGTINEVRLESWTGRLTTLGWEMPDVDVGSETRASWIVSRRIFASRDNRQRARAMGLRTESDFRAGMLSKGKPAHVEEEILAIVGPVEEGIQAVMQAGGVPVLAHPGLGPAMYPDFERILDEMVEVGLEGLEAVHPAHSAATERRIASLATNRRMLIGVGSDAHDGADSIGAVGSRSGLDLFRILAMWKSRFGH